MFRLIFLIILLMNSTLSFACKSEPALASFDKAERKIHLEGQHFLINSIQPLSFKTDLKVKIESIASKERLDVPGGLQLYNIRPTEMGPQSGTIVAIETAGKKRSVIINLKVLPQTKRGGCGSAKITYD